MPSTRSAPRGLINGPILSPGCERRQLAADRRHWLRRLERIDAELDSEPQRVRDGYDVRARRLEPVGIVYLWPKTG